VALIIFAPATILLIKSLMPGVKGSKPTDPEYFVWFLQYLVINSFLIFQFTRYLIKQSKASNALFTLAVLKKVINAVEVTEKTLENSQKIKQKKKS
jgi:divalent metal cation (Fe/Co/Zn/Cd) transporter